MTLSRALFIRFGGLGDILLATPCLRALAREFPGIAVDFVVGAGMADALSGHPLVRQIFVFDKQSSDRHPAELMRFLRTLSRTRYDLVVNLHPSAKSFLMAAAARPRRVLTFRKDMRVQKTTGCVRHAVDDFLKELRPLGIQNVTDRELDFPVPEFARARVDKLLDAEDVSKRNRLLVINPAASRPLNRWPAVRFAEVAAHFADLPGITVVVTGAPASFHTVMDGLNEVALAESVAAVDPRILNLAGRLTVKEMGALLARASAFLTCDTGPLHIGAAMHVPMTVLSGAADPDRTGPLTGNSVVLIDRNLSCAPCRDRVCRWGDVRCMDALSVENVVDVLSSMLAVTGSRPLSVL